MAAVGYWKGVALGLDQLLNTALAGYPDETLSSRIYRCGVLDKTPKKRWVVGLKIVDTLFFFQPEHCKQSYLAEQARKHSPRS